MTGYIIFQETVHDAAEFERYKEMSPVSIARFGGEFIVRGGPVETLEGECKHERVVVIAFPSTDAARSWYHSDDYKDARELRLRISNGDTILVQGALT